MTEAQLQAMKAVVWEEAKAKLRALHMADGTCHRVAIARIDDSDERDPYERWSNRGPTR